MHEQNSLEIQIAMQTVEALKKYASTKSNDFKQFLLTHIHSINPLAHMLITTKNYDVLQLAANIEKAIKIDKFRPKNISITRLAIDKHLDKICGEFNTFDPVLSKMFKNHANMKDIHDRFEQGMENLDILTQKFVNDWLQWLNKHWMLTYFALNANKDTATNAYNKLFKALTKDFCKKYKCHIDSKVVTDWATSDVKPNYGWDLMDGYHLPVHKLKFSILFMLRTPKEQTDKIIEEFSKNPEDFPNATHFSLVRINITNANKRFRNPRNLFFYMVSTFAHEMHHALDYEQPRKSALGEQINYIDRKTPVNGEIDIDEYCRSATERSSYTIGNKLLEQLQKLRC